MRHLLIVFILFALSFNLSAKNKVHKKIICNKKLSKHCFKELSKVDQNRVTTKIQTKEQARLHAEIQKRRGVASVEKSTVTQTFQKWTCAQAFSDFQSRAYCYAYCIDADDCQVKLPKK